MPEHALIAYFSMEVALENQIPTYSGGLGVLAGDTLRSAADLGLPFLGVTLLHRKGYFFQRLDAQGHQREELWHRLLGPEVQTRVKGLVSVASSHLHEVEPGAASV